VLSIHHGRLLRFMALQLKPAQAFSNLEEILPADERPDVARLSDPVNGCPAVSAEVLGGFVGAVSIFVLIR